MFDPDSAHEVDEEEARWAAWRRFAGLVDAMARLAADEDEDEDEVA